MNKTVDVVESPYFNTNMIHLSKPISKDYSELDSFVIYICPEGSYKIIVDSVEYHSKIGEAILIPAVIDKVEIHPEGDCKILEVYMLPEKD